jgi:RHS repeat-associated protein
MNRGGLQYFYEGNLGYGTSGPDNNGNVLFANTYSPEDENDVHWAITRQRYNYDSLNRLKSVTEYFVNYNHAESQQFVQTFDYDRWGNRTINSAQTSSIVGLNNTAFEIETARNRLYSPGDLALSDSQRRIRYDQAGNQVKDTYLGYGTATFDGDNRIVAIQDKFASSSTYTYNANAQRVRRMINNQETWQIYGIEGELVAEYEANGAVGTPQKEYGYRDGQLLITATSSDLKGNWKFDENSGTTAGDSSGNNNTGTLTLGATWTTGQSGTAANFDGVDDYVQVGAQSSLALTNAGTLSAWIYPTGAGSLATYGGIIINKEGEYELARFQDGTIQWAFANTNPGWGWINTGYVAPLNQWTHVAVTYDNGVVKTYINGTLFHTYSGSGAIGDYYPSQNDFRIGGRQFMSHNFQGRIDEVRVYNRALSASEVTALPGGSSSSSTQINWLVPDHLGTPRIILDQTGSFANVKRHDYLPFGEELPAGIGGRTAAMGYVAGDGVRQQFTQIDRDVETGLDYFINRYYASAQGRFTSADPLLSSGETGNPQTWNRYGYVLNNPTRLVDRYGLDDDDPQDPARKRTEVVPCTPPKSVTITTGPPQIAAGLKLPEGDNFTGPVSVFSIEVKDSDGNTMKDGFTVQESAIPTDSHGLKLIQNPHEMAPLSNGIVPDYVGVGETSKQPYDKTNPKDREHAGNVIETAVSKPITDTARQTLTVRGCGTTLTVVNDRTQTNIDPSTGKVKPYKQNGTLVNNYTYSIRAISGPLTVVNRPPK